MLNHVFTTPILRGATSLTPQQLDEIRCYLLGLGKQDGGENKSNRGGWHSSGNLFAPEMRQFPAMNEAITSALFNYIGDAFGYRGEVNMVLTGWAVINGPGDYNVPHNHAANLLSGAFYIEVPQDMKGGAIVFQDPRLNLNAHESDAIKKLTPPWLDTNISVTPVAGEMLVFPSWLMHWVEPFQSVAPDAMRIVVSFNATVV
jgi:uncharacterized protein (TIGR02466 family)